MAVKEVLYRRHIAQDELCQCCGVEVESITHVLFECESARNVWDHSDLKEMVDAAPEGKVDTKVCWWMNKYGTTNHGCSMGYMVLPQQICP